MARGPRFAFFVVADGTGVCSVRSRVCICPEAPTNDRHAAAAKAIARRANLRYRYCDMATNQKAPEFTQPDENGNPVSLEQFRGKTVVLFFYPKANTPG